MKAIRIDEHGESEVLRLEDLDLRKPKPGEVRIRLRAAGVNFVDVYQRRGDYRVPVPFTAGNEGAGIIEAVGEE